MYIEEGRTHYVGEFKVRFEAAPKPVRKKPSGTAVHEAKHVVAALENGTGVESATIIPGDGYLGLTKLSRPDAVAALAPHATGESGTGFDVFIATQMGAIGAEGAAAAIINANMDKVEAVAVALEEEKTLGSSGINKALNELRNPKPQEGIIIIENQNGERKEEKVTVRDNIVREEVIWNFETEKSKVQPKTNLSIISTTPSSSTLGAI